MNKELECKKYTLKELSEWFNCSYGSLRHQKDKKLEELKEYADFHMEKGKVVVDVVKCPEYVNPKSKANEIIQKYAMKNWNIGGPDTVSRNARLLIKEHEEVIFTVGTVAQKISIIKNELYGKLERFAHSTAEGSKGTSYRVYAKCWRDDRKPELMTQEEDIIFSREFKAMKKQAGDDTVSIYENFKELSKEEIYDIVKDGYKSTYITFLTKTAQLLHCDYLTIATVCINNADGAD